MKIENSAYSEFQKLPMFLKIGCLIYGLLASTATFIQVNVLILKLIIEKFLVYHLWLFAFLLCLIIYFNYRAFFQLYSVKKLYSKLKNIKFGFSLKRVIFLWVIIIVMIVILPYKEIAIEKFFNFLNRVFNSSLDYNEIKKVIKILTQTSPWWILILKAPIVEEIIFRFLLFYSLKNFFGKYIGITLTTILFALAHHYNYSYIILIIPSSFILVYLTHIFDSLIPSTILHIFINAIAYFSL